MFWKLQENVLTDADLENLTDFIKTPLPMIAIISFLTFLMCILLGLLAEMISRSWHEPQGKNLYQIKRIVEKKSSQ
jgi:hypothetical protein